MKLLDVLKVSILLSFAIVVVAVICYANVGLGTSLEQMANKVEELNSNLIATAFIIWSVVTTLIIANRSGN